MALPNVVDRKEEQIAINSVGGLKNVEKRGEIMKKFFQLNTKYQFDINDIVAFIYVLCAVLGIIGLNVTPLFLLGATIATSFCWQARRINLVALNVALFALNVVNFVKMF